MGVIFNRKVMIVQAESLHILEQELNKAFDKGYTVQGGITVYGVKLVVIVTKPF